MKRNVMLLLIFLPVFIQAQNLGFRLDAGIGAGLSFGSLKSYGISAATEPKMTIGSNITAGIRLEGDVLFGGKISEEAEDLSVGMTTRSAMLAKGEYYLGKSNTRPYVGFGLGRYTIANTAASGSGSASISAGNYFGLAPEAGISFGGVRLSAIYHIVTGEPLVSISAGNTQELSKNYLVIQFGFRIFGIHDREKE